MSETTTQAKPNPQVAERMEAMGAHVTIPEYSGDEKEDKKKAYVKMMEYFDKKAIEPTADNIKKYAEDISSSIAITSNVIIEDAKVEAKKSGPFKNQSTKRKLALVLIVILIIYLIVSK